jgi:hypothetical protein
MYLKAVAAQGAELSDGAIDLAAGNPSPISIILSTHGARVQGIVKADEKPAANSYSSSKVVLVPDSTDSAIRDLRTKTSSMDQNGGFTIEGIAPGTYHLYAFEKIESEEWENPDLLQQLEADAVAISLKADQTAQLTAPSFGPANRTSSLLRSAFASSVCSLRYPESSTAYSASRSCMNSLAEFI